MRRSSVVILSIMLVAFGAMFAAAGSALGPLAEDAKASKLLTRLLEARGDLVAGTRVRLSRLPGSETRLAPDGRGLVVRLNPSPQVLERRGGLRLLALRVARESLSRFSGHRVDWIEVAFEIAGPRGGTETILTLLDAGDGTLTGDPTPPLPNRYPPKPKPEAGPAAPAKG